MTKLFTTCSLILTIISLTQCHNSNPAKKVETMPNWTLRIETSNCTLPETVWWAPQAQLADGTVILAGGQVPNANASVKFESQTQNAWLIHPKTCEVQAIKPGLSTTHAGTDAVMTPTQVWFFGGSSSTTIEAYENGSITTRGDLTIARSGSGQILLPNGKILITGGYDKSAANSGVLASAEILDPATGQSQPLGNMNFKRAGHTLNLLPNGNVLITGGAGEGQGTAEIFNPTTNTFTNVSSPLNFSRKDHRSVVDLKGLVWLMGGTSADNTNPTTLEYFDPADQTFHNTTLSLSVGREDSAVFFSEELNAIIVMGGQQRGTLQGRNNPPSDVVDVIDLTQNKTYSQKLPLGARDDGNLVLIPDSTLDRKIQILVVQGVQEIYDDVGKTVGKLTAQPELITIEADL